MWNRKRIAYTAVSMIVAAALLWLLSLILSADGIDIATQLTCLIFVGVTLGAMICGLGEAAATEERRRQRLERVGQIALGETPSPRCDKCGDRIVFVKCQTHGLLLCWTDYMRHDPYERCEVTPVFDGSVVREARA